MGIVDNLPKVAPGKIINPAATGGWIGKTGFHY
jgi:hypothetical protein